MKKIIHNMLLLSLLQKNIFYPSFINKIKNKNIVPNPLCNLVLVNKQNYLSPIFKPSDLVIPNIPFNFEKNLAKKFLRKEAAKALEDLFLKAKQDDMELLGISAYRSYWRQRRIFINNLKQDGFKKANQYSACPGQSEHQTGLAIDLSSPKIDGELIEKFGETLEGKWLKENAPKYGFILRYPKGKEEITGYQYEPWHIRYVGIPSSLIIEKNNLVLEEYLNFNAQ
ncbi:M15 family metallopeptidase [Halonatronum saccharophilum]|uniref:M15 family metallopeptidase n=1 Tax=Halonatronum saccharophilum TaxID=150060 RepID=UPI0004B69BCF|nr:M15 family metallopeptidase [Halonatronum saccharophilum]